MLSIDNGYMLVLHFNNVSLDNCNIYICEGRYKGMIQYASTHLIVKGKIVMYMRFFMV